ncbi:LOW QUALITY PROTEIN: protein Shroom2-like [Cottoperca gobio]|uniref:LOW QUALITY PROTEIN: protein Shroom2-like n=1 Tax=Cottoperca gobio TaxID=56716 RepID=A0A6J2QS31_COTGO|nr:LOW QUALITY PROTEIN: protein Shroom2-like [Cottoperca gobio]
MDAVDYRDDLRVSAGRMKWWREVDMWRGTEEEDEELVEVLLRGKAPWGFTLRGGTEHREPLVITKVEEGSAAAAVCLQAGDEMVSVNAVPLSGSRQEAICLVKSSHKTLTLVVRRKNRFKGKNDPGSRPHSWHSSKLTEVESQPAGREVAPAPVWQPNHEARPKESSNQGDQNTQRQLTSQFGSVDNMERVERPSHPYPAGRLSPNKYISSAEPLSGPGGKRDSGFSCFSINHSPPVHDPSSSDRKGTSTENIFFKGPQSERLQQAERPRYLQPTLGNGGWEGSRGEEQPVSRVSVARRPSIGPVWQVPEKKKSQSPPPPPPPLRSDSFAATKVLPYSEGPSGLAKSHGRSFEKLTENSNLNGLRSHQEKPSEARRSFNPLTRKDFLHPSTASDHNHNQLHPNKLFSLSSNDVRQSHYTQLPAHQRQYSDESPLYMQARPAPPTKIQSVGSYYRSLQDLPTRAFSRKHVRHSTASMASSAANPSLENGGHNRYYSLARKHLVQTAELQARQGKAEGRRGETEKPHWVNSNEPGLPSSLKTNVKAIYSLPQSQLPYSSGQERCGHSYLGNGQYYDHQTSERSVQGCSQEDAAKRGEGHANDPKRHFPTNQGNDHKVSLSRHQDPWVPQEDQRISPLKTPLLHSLAQESRSLTVRQPAAVTTGVMSTQDDSGDNMAASNGKSNRRSDRYATTLRNEIQQKRAQLQKSRSAATLTCDVEDEEAEEWRSIKTSTSSGVSNTYKDHLKEAQARVLQATSFQRRDLEPLGPEVSIVKTSQGRIRGRKRFPLAKRMHSFSEPDKIDKVGVEGEAQTGSFGERRKFFEAKPAFSRPVLKSNQGTNLNTDLGEIVKPNERTPSGEPGEAHPSTDPKHLSPGHTQVLLDQQRLGTFAEYQATWNKQKKSSETKTQGRYHSADNILDADAEEKAVCIHERSRSSPSADFYTQNIPSQWKDPPDQQSSYSGKPESRLRSQPDRSPQSAPSVSRNEGPVPGLTDHRTKPDAANPSHTTHSSGPRSLSPNAGSQHSSQLPQIKGLLPPPKPHIGPETTSSSQEFLAGAQADPKSLQPLSSCSSDTQRHDTAQKSSAGPAPASSPHLRRTSRADMSRGGGENEVEKEQPQPPSSSSVFSSWTAALSLSATERARSPSPQFAPLRLTDKPPAVFVQDDSPLRSDADLTLAAEMDVSGPVRKVPVRIVHAESSSEREGRAYLPQSSETCSVFEPRAHIPSLSTTERPASSLFSAYTRQAPQDLHQGFRSDQTSVPESSSAGARRSEEDAKREELVRDIMGKDKSLVDILDQSGRMTTMDLMEGLFSTEEQILEGVHQRKRASSGSRLPTSSPRSMDRREEDDVSVSAAASLVPSSSYYNTSAPKAELLIKMKDMQEQLEDSEDELDVDLASKKQELISSLARKLEVLKEARHSLQEDVEDNEALGREVEATVQRLCQANQLDKFCMFVGDLDKVVSLLLSLSGRLARVENALNSLEDEAPPEEKRTLTRKRKLLMQQHEDAKELKENLDRRERLVSSIMEAHLDAENLDDYRHFVKMKSALIIEQRKLEDKINLGEEQLKCLVDSLPLEQRPPL